MLYKVIQHFGPDHPWWADFVKDHWIQPLTAFDSVDGILAPDVFFPQSDEDWEHCVPEDFRTSFIKDQEYAKKICRNKPGSRVVGIVENEDCDDQAGLLGYDILDHHNCVSLITNWGPHDKDYPLIGIEVGSNGLIHSYKIAVSAMRILRDRQISDHTPGSIWAIFSLSQVWGGIF